MAIDGQTPCSSNTESEDTADASSDGADTNTVTGARVIGKTPPITRAYMSSIRERGRLIIGLSGPTRYFLTDSDVQTAKTGIGAAIWMLNNVFSDSGAMQSDFWDAFILAHQLSMLPVGTAEYEFQKRAAVDVLLFLKAALEVAENANADQYATFRAELYAEVERMSQLALAPAEEAKERCHRWLEEVRSSEVRGDPKADLAVTVQVDTGNTAPAARKRLPAILTKQSLYVERLDCFAVSLVGVERGTACLRFARSPCFNVSAVLITLFSTVHFAIGGSGIADFSAFFEATFGMDAQIWTSLNGSFVPSDGSDPVAVSSRLDAMDAFLDIWGVLGCVLFAFQCMLISVILLTLNVPAARRSLASFNGLFQLYNVARWSFSFYVSFVYVADRDKLLYIFFVAGMFLCWTAADGMQVHRLLRVYLGMWLVAYLLVFFMLCLLRRGFVVRNRTPLELIRTRCRLFIHLLAG